MKDDELPADSEGALELQDREREVQPARGAAKRGFAAMDAKRQREIASQGGRAAHKNGTAHHFSSEEAREAGRRGGRSVSSDRAHMAEIGRAGGVARGRVLRVEQPAAPVISPAATEVDPPKHE